ncbi:MAG TPA: MFS transporter [Trebonia sp.]|nr:MFS transporter [Trebonia sp.]
MTATAQGAAPAARANGLWRRQLDHYPDTRPRMAYLAIVVLVTIALYYALYIPGAVAPLIIAHFGMTFNTYIYIIVISNAVGAFGSVAAGLSDRWGRANLVAYGVVIVGLLVLFGIPNAGSTFWYGFLFSIIGVIEGVILVATPALVRDFSPQLGRASAMGFWTLGPVLGSLVVAVVSTNTLNHLTAWQDQFIICGIAVLVVGAIAVVGLRELSPQLRDQLMVSMRDRTLIEAKARGLKVESLLDKPWRQMLRLDIIGSAFAISVFLLIYYTAVGFFTVYFTTLHGFSLSTANSIGNWFWAFDAAALIIIGIISDRVGVRKPFMVLGAVGAVIMTIIFLNLGHGTTYATFAIVISINAVFLAIAYAPWMASYTETVEKHNPALVATGLAVWGWIIRAVIAISFLIMPLVISSMTPLVTYGTQVATLSAQYAPELAFAQSHPTVVAAAQKVPPAVVATAQSIPPTVLATAQKIPPTVVATAQANATQLANAQKFAPELAVIQAHPALFARLATYKNPAAIPPSLVAQAISAAGGGAKGLKILTTIAANQAAITGVIAAAPALKTVAPYAADLTTIAPYSAQLTTIAPYSAELTIMAPYGPQLTALSKVPKSDLLFLQEHGPSVVSAAAAAPGEWKNWWWVCVGGEVVFIPLIFLMTGRWSPRRAREDAEAHQRLVEEEMAKLQEQEA